METIYSDWLFVEALFKSECARAYEQGSYRSLKTAEIENCVDRVFKGVEFFPS